MDDYNIDTRLVVSGLTGVTTLLTLATLETLIRRPRLGLGLIFISIIAGVGVYIYDALTE
jgi:hypothetical protein